MRSILFVIDDLWASADLRPFLQSGERCAQIVTTRNLDKLTIGFERVNVGVMQQEEAVNLLAAGFEDDPDFRLAKVGLARLATRAGYFPLLLILVNGYLRKAKFENTSLIKAVESAEKKLRKSKLTELTEAEMEDERKFHDAVGKTLSLSLEELSERDLDRYIELAYFPESTGVRFPTVVGLWNKTSNLDEEAVRNLCVRLNRRSLLIYDDSNETVLLHDVIRDYLAKEYPDRIRSMSSDSKLRTLQLKHIQSIKSPNITLRHDLPDLPAFNKINGCKFSIDGKRILTASDDGSIKVWKAASGRLKTNLKGKDKWNIDGHSDAVKTGSFRPYSTQLVSASADHSLKIWEIHPRKVKVLRTLKDDPKTGEKGHSKTVNDCCFSPDGSLMVSASDDKTLRIWDVNNDWQSHALNDSDPIMCCTFGNDGKWIISLSSTGAIKIRDVVSGEILHTPTIGHSVAVNSCSFSDKSRKLVSAYKDHTLKVWDVDDSFGKPMRELAEHSEAVNGCCFSTDGKLVVSASSDHTVKIWDVATGHCRATFYADGEMYCCAMHGDMIVAGGARGVYFLKLLQ